VPDDEKTPAGRYCLPHTDRDERPGLRETLAFAWKRFGSFVVAPLMPLVMVVFLGFFLFLGGLVGAIPGIGTIFAGLLFFLAILAKSATGQKLSVYTTLVRGPKRTGELEGPDEFHLVLLDNGRIGQLAGPLREALYCLRCGACLNVCPVYRQIGGHAYGYTYPGPIGILLTAMSHGPASVKDLAHASSLCGACADACPVRIDIPRMLIELRREVDEKKIAPWGERVAFKTLAALLLRPRLSEQVAREEMQFHLRCVIRRKLGGAFGYFRIRGLRSKFVRAGVHQSCKRDAAEPLQLFHLYEGHGGVPLGRN